MRKVWIVFAAFWMLQAFHWPLWLVLRSILSHRTASQR